MCCPKKSISKILGVCVFEKFWYVERWYLLFFVKIFCFTVPKKSYQLPERSGAKLERASYDKSQTIERSVQ